jgi:primosomal protein N' (replication factor Y)
MTGFVAGFPESPPAGVEPRPIAELLDRESPFPPDLLELARFAAGYYLVPLGEMLAAMAPPGGVFWGERRLRLTDGGALAPARDALESAIREHLVEHGRSALSELEESIESDDLDAAIDRGVADGRFALEERSGSGSRYQLAVELAPGPVAGLRERCGRSPAGRAVVDFLAQIGRAALASEVEAAAGCGPAVLKRLVKLGVLRRFTQPEALSLDRYLFSREAEPAELVLRDDQGAALEGIRTALAAGEFRRFLLQGMTGSGKSEVYLRAAAEAVERGRSALLLVPEIALVPALAADAIRRFGDLVAVLHSGLGEAERAQEWEKVRSGRARVVVGARSALFAPLAALGLVVVDEEQDLAYKQDNPPRYHGRDLAIVRAKLAGAAVVLVSATPSLETRLAAAEERSATLGLTSRAGIGIPVEGILVDLRAEPGTRRPGEILFSARLRAELERTLAAGDQAILLRNRRGYAPLLLCRSCGEDFRCAQCGLPRTLHRRDRKLLCHYCGSSLPLPALCPVCRAETLEPVGAGTERVEEDLAALFPGVAIDVLDRDTARRSGGPAAILERFARGESRLLVGTQMVSKGHHFPDVTLTAVLSADGYLGFPDFRAVEKTYALLTQIAGRAGRGERAGRVVIQTFLPDHYAIRAALERDDAAFAEQELRFRRAFHYPPYTRMIQILARDRNRERALGRLEEIAARISGDPRASALRVTGPAPAPLERLRGEWRFQLLLRGASGSAVRTVVRDVVGERPPAGVAIDVDPYHLL